MTQWMRGRLDAAVVSGFVLAGCSDRAISDSGGSDPSEGTGSSTSDAPSSTSGSTASGGSTGLDGSAGGSSDSDELPRFDIGSRYDVSLPSDVGVVDCGVVPTRLPSNGCIADPGSRLRVICMPGGELDACPAATDESVSNAFQTCVSCALTEPTCGPAMNDEGNCCYWAYDEECTPPGRPFVVGGVARLAELTASDAWIEPGPLELAERDASLAAAWLHDARTEHAAIASFARFALHLLALAAPPSMVTAAQRAALDELAHARLCFTLAVRHGAIAAGPGAIDTADALAPTDDVVTIVLATVREGCVAETISAMQLSAARDGAADPWLRARLGEMLDQELAHVELAWTFVGWALARGDERLRASVREAFDEAPRWIPVGAAPEPEAEAHASWRRAGRLPRADRLRIARTTIETLVLPTAAAMLRRSERTASRVHDRALA